MKTRTILMVSAVMFSVFLAEGQGTLIVNGYFNTDASGWTTNAASGYYELLKGDPGGCFTLYGSIGQTVDNLTPGSTYRIAGSYDVEAGGVGSTPSFGVTLNGILAYQVAPLDYAWHNFSFNYTATSSTAVLDLIAGINGTGDDYRVDNISMATVPEPGALSLVGLGTALGFRIKRHLPRSFGH